MKTPVVEVSFTSRLLPRERRKSYGPAGIAVNRKEAVGAGRLAREAGSSRAKMMTSALADRVNVLEAMRGECDCLPTKPIQKAKWLEELRRVVLIA